MSRRRCSWAVSLFSALFLLLCLGGAGGVGGGAALGQGLPPAQVVVSGVARGAISPEMELIGTVYYQDVSMVASEVGGLAEEVLFEEGDGVEKGDVLVRLDSRLLEKTIESKEAAYGQVLSDLERARLDLGRVENLFKEGFVPEQAYDESRFLVKGLERRGESLKAEIGGLKVELEKKTMRAPFSGVIITRDVFVGEWLPPGGAVATLAKVDTVEVVVDVPEAVMRTLEKGTAVRVSSGGREASGRVFAIIPRGDVKTRTFPMKIRVRNTLSLIEGMEARVTLPGGERRKALIVDRDAVIEVFGHTAVFAVVDGKAKMVPVEVVGYSGSKAGVLSPALREGMDVVIKGNERLRDGQLVKVMKAGK